MSQELHDERLSAYLDGELTPGERAEVEELLRTSSAHQQVVSELVSLRDSLKSLPHYTLGNEFAPRVVSAARLAAQERDAAAGSIPQKVNHTAVVLSRSRRSWVVASAGALAATAAAIAIIVFSFSGPDGEVAKVKAKGESEQKQKPGTQQPPLANEMSSEFVRAIASSKENEAVVVRVKLTKDAIRGKLLDEALKASGIGAAPPDLSNEAAQKTGIAYKELVKSQDSSSAAKRGAGDVLFVEADVAKLEKALRELEKNPAVKATFAPESLIASAGKGPDLGKNPEGEAGSGDPASKSKVPTGGYFQHLPPRGYMLAPAATPPGVKSGDKVPAKKTARVLIVVEVVE